MTEKDITDAAVKILGVDTFENEHDLQMAMRGFARGVVYMNERVRAAMKVALIDESEIKAS